MAKPLKPEDLETPGLTWRRRSKNRYVGYWVCRADIAERGYSLKTQRLWPPDATPDALPELDDWQGLSVSCIRLQTEMLEWANGLTGAVLSDPRQRFDGTVGSLVDIFLSDPDSPFFANRYKTRITYESRMLAIKNAVGQARIVPRSANDAKLTFREFKRWEEKWSAPKELGGPLRPTRASEFMKFVRILFSFGVMAELPRCKELHDVLSEMKFKAPKKRSKIVTREHAVAIIAEAHRVGKPSIALAQALMSDFMMRQKDVIGEWVPMSEPGMSAVLARGQKWLVGLTWEEIQNGVLDHRLSKSLRGKNAISDPEAGKSLPFTIELYPLAATELARVPESERHGPIVKAEHSGLPWRQKVFAANWRTIARAAGVPDDVQNRDSRAGAASDAESKGASRSQVRPALGHSREETTDIYLRNERSGPDNLARLRFGKNGPQTP